MVIIPTDYAIGRRMKVKEAAIFYKKAIVRLQSLEVVYS